MKKSFTLISAILLLSSFTHSSFAAFQDVTNMDPDSAAYNFVQTQGIMTGSEDGNFHPELGLTRCELAKVTVTAGHFTPLTGDDRQEFSDVPMSNWCHQYVRQLKYAGVLNGYPDGTFHPNQKVTQIEALKILINAGRNGVMLEPVGNQQFSDVKPSDWWAPYIQLAQNSLYTNNPQYIRQSASYGIQTEMSRAETAYLTWKLFATSAPTNGYVIGGTIKGLTNPAIISNNVETLTVKPGERTFKFPTKVAKGQNYLVKIIQDPTGEKCYLKDASGVVNDKDIVNIQLECAPTTGRNPFIFIPVASGGGAVSSPTHSIGGNVIGLHSDVTLQNNSGDNLVISDDGSFAFSTPIAEGRPYNVTVHTQPAGQTCTVTHASGTVGSADVSNVNIQCYNQFVYATLIDQVNQYNANPANGLLSSATTSTNTTAVVLAFATVGNVQYAYTTDQANGIVYRCSINVDGTLSACVSAISDNSLINAGANPYGIAFTTINGTQYAYVTDISNSVIFQCFFSNSSDGLFDTCTQQNPTIASGGFSSPLGISFGTVNDIQYAYIADVGVTNVFQCSLDALTGAITLCSSTPIGAPSWAPAYVILKSISGTTYAYVASQAAPAIYKCAVNNDGSLSTCAVTPPINPPSGINWAPGYIAFATFSGTQYAYIASANGSGGGGIYQCILDNLGEFQDCQLTGGPFAYPPSYPLSVAFRFN